MIDFKNYDKKNPKIWEAFVKNAKLAKLKGFNNYSANGIFEIIRWHTNIEGTDRFKISNNFRPDYARKMMKMYPEFKSFFRTKKLKSLRKK